MRSQPEEWISQSFIGFRGFGAKEFVSNTERLLHKFKVRGRLCALPQSPNPNPVACGACSISIGEREPSVAVLIQRCIMMDHAPACRTSMTDFGLTAVVAFLAGLRVF